MLDERTCLALILGTSEFPTLALDDNPAFANSAEELQRYLIARDGGPASFRVESLFDSSAGVADQCDQIVECLERNSDATELLLYYVGHGDFTRSRDYYLVLRCTRKPWEDTTGLRVSTLAGIVRRHFANRRVYVLLDCCFAGEAVREFQAGSVAELVENQTLSEFPESGTALLLASSKNEPAISPASLPRTMFCEGLMSVLNEGIAEGEPHLSLAAIADRIRSVLRDRFGGEAVLPEIHTPRQQAGDVARTPLFPNPAYVAADALDRSVLDALSNDLPRVRAAAVDLLVERLNDGGGPTHARARELLERLAARDDSNLVRTRAAQGLGASDGSRPEPEPERAADPESALAVELSLTASPSRSRIDPGETVRWTCTVHNAGMTKVEEIELTDREGSLLRSPFSLAADGRKRVEIQRQYGMRGAQERFAVLGRAPDGRLVSAEHRARVRVRRPGLVKPEKSITAGNGHPGAPEPPDVLSVPRFRAALRELKVKVDINDMAANRLIELLAEGERHYRIASGMRPIPADWVRRVTDWNRAAVAAGPHEAIVLVKLTAPTPAEILEGLESLSRRTLASTGVRIPTDEFP